MRSAMASRLLAHRTEIALRHDAAHVLGGRGLQPDDMGRGAQEREIVLVGDDAAGGRDHRRSFAATTFSSASRS